MPADWLSSGANFKVIRQTSQVLQTMPSKDDYRLQLRNEAIAGLSLIDLSQNRKLVASNIARSYVFADSALQRYAFINHDDEAVVRRVHDDQEVFRTDSQAQTRFALPLLSPERWSFFLKE